MQQKGHAFLTGVSLAPEDNTRKTKTNSRLADYILLSSKIRVAAFMSAAFLFVFLGLFVFPIASSIDGTQATSEPGEPEITIGTSNLSLEFQVEAVNGSFSEDSTDVSVSTTSKAGYTLSIETGNDGDNASKLVGENKSFNSLSSAVSEADFSAANATELNGLWGFKPSKIDGEDNTDYLPVPVETTTIEQTNAANVEANVYEIGLGARADFTYEAGVYTNTFVITSVVNPVGYTITYNKNTNDTVTNMPANQSGTTMEQTVTLASESPVRDGYEFRGWCDGTVSGHTCEGTVYQPGGSYSLEQATSVTLVAIWREETVCNPSAQSIDTAVCMQDMNSDVASTMVTEQQYQLVDSRDGKEYWISKLADGNIWMTQNLDFDLDSTKALSSEDTDINALDANDTAYSTENNVIYWTPDKSTTDISNGTIPDDSNNEARSSDVGDWYSTGAGLVSAQHNYLAGNGGDYFSTTPSLTIGTHGHVGNYYNWFAATAGGYGVGENDNESGTAYNSICPANWSLPRAGRDLDSEELNTCNNYSKDAEGCLSKNDYYGIVYNYNDGGFFGGLGFENSPAYLVRAGTVSGTALKNAGYDGYFWTSQGWGVDDNTIPYSFEFMYRSTASDTFDWYSSVRQRSVRCIARDSEPSTENNEYSLIYFDGNGADDFEDNHYGTHKEYVADQLMKRGGTVKLRSNKYIRREYGYDEDIAFLGWNTDRNGNGTFYADGADFTTNASEVTLYAQWDTDYLTIIYDSNLGDGQTYRADLYDDDGEISMTILPYNYYFENEGYYNAGWNTEPDGSGTTYEEGYKYITTALDAGKTIVLYAQWVQPIAMLDDGPTVKDKIMALSISSGSIDAINMANDLPNGFVPTANNTISDPENSNRNIYMWRETVEGEGILYIYSETGEVVLNSDSSELFRGLELDDVDFVEDWDSSGVTNMDCMFCSSSIPDISGVSNWDTSNVTNMSGMFSTNWLLTDISAISNWNTSNVTDMSWMFFETSVVSIDAMATGIRPGNSYTSWDVSNVTDMGSMFEDAQSLADISAVATWDTSSVTNMNSLFSGAWSLESIDDVADWDTSNVSDMSWMFNHLNDVTDFSAVSNWNTSNVEDMSGMFYVTGIESLDPLATGIRPGNDYVSWDVSNVTNMSQMFDGLTGFEWTQSLNGWDVSSVEDMTDMFGEAPCSIIRPIWYYDDSDCGIYKDAPSNNLSIEQSYDIWYSTKYLGMYADNGDGTYRRMQPDEVAPSGVDTRYAFQDVNTSICNGVTVLDSPYGVLDTSNWSIVNITKSSSDGLCHRLDTGAVIP